MIVLRRLGSRGCSGDIDPPAIEIGGNPVHRVGRLPEFLTRPGDDVGFEERIDLSAVLSEIVAAVLAGLRVIDKRFGD